MYNYETEKANLFTPSGVKQLMEVRDQVKYLIDNAGAFTGGKISVAGDSWTTLAALDYLVEEGELVKLRKDSECWGQYQVYASPKVYNS